MTRTIGRKEWERAFRPRSIAGSPRFEGTHVGIVKANDDPQHMGRLRVYIPEYGGNGNDENTWYIVSYASPFGGSTSFLNLQENGQDMGSSTTSYGWWATPPDLDNQVLLTFANGDPGRGYWFACLYQQNMNHMVPGVPVNVPTDPTLQPPKGIDGALPPVVEYNRWSDVNPDAPPRPVFTPLHDALLAQGLYPDSERGPASSGARRESPSRVYGYLTPNSHTIHVDENPDNEFIRMRTRNGTQILIHDTTGYVYINSKSGNSWLEVSDQGIDCYTAGSYSMRAQTDINIHADRDIFLNAGGAIALNAGTSILLNSGQNTEIAVGASLHSSAAGNITNNAGANILNTAGAAIASEAGGSLSEKSGGANIRSAPNIYDNSSTAAPSAGAPVAAQRPANQFIDPKISGGLASSVVNRLPTHEPWYGHPRSNSAIGGTAGGPVNNDGNNLSNQHVAGNAPTTASNNVQTGTGNVKQVDSPIDNSAIVKGCGSMKISDNVKNAIKSAASTIGVDKNLMFAVAHHESAFQPGISAGANGVKTSAAGLYQIVDGTWEQIVKNYGGTYNFGISNKLDPRANALGGAILIKNSAAGLQKNGLPSGPTEIYTCLFLGDGGAHSFLKAYQADPNQIAANISHALQKGAAANVSLFYKNGQPVTAAQLYQTIGNIIMPLYNCYVKLNL